MMKLISILLAAAFVAGAAPMAVAGSSAVVFMYHRFGEGDFPSTNTRLDQLDAHIAELKKGGFSVRPVIDIIDDIKSGKPLAERTIAITIDDGYRSIFDHAWPRLKKAGFPFSVFVATDAIDRGQKSHMTWDQIRTLQADGVTIGAHTASHMHMVEASDQRIRAELKKSNQRYRKELGRVPDIFALPYGEASSRVLKLIRGAGYRYAFGQHSGVVNPTTNPYYAPRFALNENFGGLKRFRLLVNALPIPVTDMTPFDVRDGVNNPPSFGFTIAARLKHLNRLNCFSSHEGRLRLERLGPRIEVRMTKPMPSGRRTRINCTMRDTDGRWRWLGTQFYLPK